MVVEYCTYLESSASRILAVCYVALRRLYYGHVKWASQKSMTAVS